MSGGEQQMLTIARTLMGNPSCVLLDEPSEGLAPIIVEEMGNSIRALKGEGVSHCEGKSHPIRTGDSFLVRPGHDHIVENTGGDNLYCLTVMVPNEGFAELVRSGIPMTMSEDDGKVLRRG